MSEGDVQPPTMKVAEAHNIGEFGRLAMRAVLLRQSDIRHCGRAKGALQVRIRACP